MTASAFPALTTAEQIFKDVIWTPMLTAGENWLELEVPFLDLPVVKQLDESAINAITDAIYAQICELIDVEAIQLVSAAAQNAYDSAFEALSVIATESGTTSQEYANAKAKALAELSNFTHLAG